MVCGSSSMLRAPAWCPMAPPCGRSRRSFSSTVVPDLTTRSTSRRLVPSRYRPGRFLDQRGNGRSDPGPRESWTLAQWGDDVRALLRGARYRAARSSWACRLVGRWPWRMPRRHPAHPAKLILGKHGGRRRDLSESAGSRCSSVSAGRRSAPWPAGGSSMGAHGRRPRSRPGFAWPSPSTVGRPAIPTRCARAIRHPEVTRWFTRPGGEWSHVQLLSRPFRGFSARPWCWAGRTTR